MSVYVGKSGAKRKASTIYIGKSGSRKEVVEAYYGKNGRQRVYNIPIESGQKIFTSSGWFTVPKRVKKVDVFLVGGGGAGGWGYGTGSGSMNGGSGGGSGYTTTIKGVSVTPGASYSVIVGAGLTSGSKYNTNDTSSVGGTSSAFGGKAGGGHCGVYQNCYWDGVASLGWGYSCGGSGGGINSYYVNAVTAVQGPAPGGTDGSWGYVKHYTAGYMTIDAIKNSSSYSGQLYLRGTLEQCSSGQGNTTRAFGESSGTLYSSGGNGGGSSTLSISDASSNTGNGGDGAGCSRSGNGWLPGAAGGSGCVIIRWGY